MTEKAKSDPKQADPSDDQHRFLILMRHAKSDWSDQSLSDHDRPLNHRGQRDAPRMADWLAEMELIPDMVLSSSSTRTRETIGLMTPQWGCEPIVSFTESLYLAGPDGIVDCIRSDALDSRRLMVLGHNPGMTHLTSILADQSVDMPTAAIAIFEVELGDWSELHRSTPIRMVHFMRPKAL